MDERRPHGIDQAGNKMQIKLRYKLGALLALLLGLWVLVKTHPKGIVLSEPLPNNVAEKVSVKNGIVTIQTPKGIKHISGVREGSITLMKDGTSKLDVRTFGWEHQIGMNGFVNTDGGAVGLDLRFFYYKQFDVMLGLGYGPRTQKMDTWLGIGYTPHTSWMSNTTIFLGYSVRNNPVAGVSVRF